MASSSDRLPLLAVAILLQLLVLSAPASAAPTTTKFIDAVCQRVQDKSYCLKTLTSYPPTATATALIPLADAVIHLGISHAEKTIGFIDEAVKKEPAALKKTFADCRDAYVGIVASFRSASGELTTSPDTANYDVEVSHDHTRRVRELVGKNSDSASKTVVEMTDQMDLYMDLAGGATDAVDDDHENRHA